MASRKKQKPPRVFGRLLAIGGAEDPDVNDMHILPHFVKICGGRRARIVVCGAPAEDVAHKERKYKKIFERLGAASVFETHIRSRVDGLDEELMAATRRATGVFFTGGDQLRLTTNVAGTAFAECVHERLWNDGLVVGGTSAGAAAMSSTMLIGGRNEGTVRRSDIRLAPGFGFLRDIIIDTHFAQRGRISRLLAVLAQNPEILAIGIDENTAIEVDPANRRFTVLGDGATFVLDGTITYSNAADAAEEDVLTTTDSLLHILSAGYGFDLAGKRPLLPDGKAIQGRQ